MKAFPAILLLLVIFFTSIPLRFLGENQNSTPLLQAAEDFGTDRSLENAHWTVYIKDVTAGQTLVAHHIDKPLLPASIQKLYTTSSAIMMLGSDFQYETLLQHDGSVDQRGVLNGNLYITGSGDPTFGAVQLDDTLSLDYIFANWVKVLQGLGINKINGGIIADERIFDNELVPRRWVWEHIGNYFGAGISGLSGHENEYTVFFDAGPGIGSPASVVRTEPHVPGMTLLNEVHTGPAGSGDQVYIFGAPWISERHLTGTVPLGARNFPVRGSIHDPPGFVAESFRVFLLDRGIEISGGSTSYRTIDFQQIYATDERITLHTHLSPFLFDIIYRTNLYSVNSYTESLLKTIGAQFKRPAGTSDGLKAIQEYWEKKGFNSEQLVLYDGSGLSPSNRLTANQLMTILDETSKHPAFGILMHSLPLAGYSGSLANQMLNTPSEGRLRAKSGFLNNVRSYAGYTTMQNGNLAAFVIIANDYKGTPAAMRQKMLHLMNEITKHQ